jgi:uncharacterized protein YndB with AHSA1/START domain
MAERGEIDFGVLDLRGPLPTVRFTVSLPHSPDKVWRALTEPAHLEGWFPTTVDGPRTAGATLVFRFLNLDIPPMEGTMVAFDPPHLLEFLWGADQMRFELAAADGGSVLQVSDTVQELGKAARDAAGWHVCLEGLGALLHGRDAPLVHADRWEQVHPTYVQRFGPAASTLGPPEEWEEARRQGRV